MGQEQQSHPPRLQCQESSLEAFEQQLQSQAAIDVDHASSLEEVQPTAASGTVAVANERLQGQGVLLGTNTVEAFQSVDKNQLIKNHFLPSFLQGDLQALTMFVLLTYAGATLPFITTLHQATFLLNLILLLRHHHPKT